MANRSAECCRVDLTALVEDGPECLESQSALRHLETCAECQRELEALAGSDEWWRDCRTNLSTPELHRDSARAHESEPLGGALGSGLSQLLAPPSHPEMLGRIGRYEVERLLGSGGMGVVFKAFDSELNRPVAIKVLAPHLAGSGAARQRFGREARAAAAVVHEHVVAIHDVEVGATPPYLVMQYVPGESLQSYVDRHGPLEIGDLVRIGYQVASGLAAAHAQGLVHRDVKPGNIMLENGLGRVVITDFGLARAADDASLTHSGIVAGTPHYMAPEQARGDAVDARSDLFSLGAVLYFMASGHPPFRAEQAMAVLHRICHDRQRPLDQIDPRIPDELGDVIDRLLEKKPSRRFASASEVQQVLAGILGREQRRRWYFARRFGRLARKRWPLGSGMAAALLAAGGVAWLAGWQEPGTNAGNHQHESSFADAVAAVAGEAEAVDTATRQPNFASELAAIDRSLSEIAGKHFPEAAIGPVADSWMRDVSAALKEVSRLEASWPAGYEGDSPLKPEAGEMR
jgi:eukaryotic-like serine/threonine-protein kinase